MASLKSLVAGWNARMGQTTRFTLEAEGDFDGLPDAAAVNLYRIAQEGLTTRRHAGAARVTLTLERAQTAAEEEPGNVGPMTIEDDGKGYEPGGGQTGLGLSGVRESDRHVRRLARRQAWHDGRHMADRDAASGPGSGGRVMTRAIRVMLVDDHAIVLEGYRRLIEKQEGIEVVAEATDSVAAYQRFMETAPDVVVVDISMPGRGGIDLIRQIRLREPSARIVCFTMHQNVEFAIHAFRPARRGMSPQSSKPMLLIHAIKEVAQGRRMISPDVSEELALGEVGSDETALASCRRAVRDPAAHSRRVIDKPISPPRST